MAGEGALIEESAEKTILLVDDEANIIRALVRLLRRDGYTILTANSGQEGLDILKKQSVGVIISDQRMPEMSGVEFLSKVKELYPDTMRIVLSGYTDLNSVTDAINHGAIYKFLTKPWEDELIRENIAKAFDHYKLASENKRLNEELHRLNEVLENRVKEQNRESALETHALKITQQVLDKQAVGVIGISNDGTVVVANEMSHKLLEVPEGSLITRDICDVTDGAVCEAIVNAQKSEEVSITEVDEGQMKYIICTMMAGGEKTGVVLTIIPNKTIA